MVQGISSDESAEMAVSRIMMKLYNHIEANQAEMPDVFKSFDVSNDGFIEAKELSDGLRRLGL